MRTLLSLAVVGTVIAVTSGTAAAQYTDQTRRTNQQYSESLRKGAAVVREEPVAQVETVTQQVSVLHIDDQFPEQGADNPSGLLSNEDWNSENSSGGAETAIRPGFPFTMGNNPMELDPQEAPPHYRRGGSATIITR